jgi:hypothetical protein
MRLIRILVSAAVILVCAAEARAQDLLVPAGTILQCTLNEPNLSSKTTTVGDPVVCHLRGIEEFDRMAFPRGSMLGGHLEAAKEPGHFVGKGYLKVTFDRVILPYGDLPVPAKVIAARGYKVDKKGDINGKGHAKRDVAEWMFPPLWPWKVLSLPARGPRPALKGEEPLQLRLMDDVVVPRTLAYGPSGDANRPPYATPFRPAAGLGIGAAGELPKSNPQLVAAKSVHANSGTAENNVAPRLTIIVLKSEETYVVERYRIDGEVLLFRQWDGTTGAVDLSQVDWTKTSKMTQALRTADTASSVAGQVQ